MKVLMFGWEYPPLITGGLGTACYGLSQSMSRLVSKITFVLPKIKGYVDAGSLQMVDASDYEVASEREFSQQNVEVISIQSTLRPYINETDYKRDVSQLVRRREKSQGRAGSPFSGDYGDDLYAEVLRYAEAAGPIALAESYDVIHAHDWMTFLAGIKAREMTGKPLVVHVHALELDRAGEQVHPEIFRIEKEGMRQADRVVAVSERTKKLIVARYGIEADKVEVVHNGVMPLLGHQLKRRSKPFREKLVVFLGRVTMQKGPEYFLEAAYLVHRKLKNVRFVMAGNGDLLPKVILRMAELRLTDRFHFTGFINDQGRNQLLSMADLFVMSSVSEPFGITPLEALQHDVPVIVSKQSGVAEVLQHTIKVDFWDVRRMSDAIINVLTHEALTKQLIEGGRRDMEAIHWDHGAEKIVNIYKGMI